MKPIPQAQQYLKTKVETSSPGELTLLLYEELFRKLSSAKTCFLESDNNASQWLEKLHGARSIMYELMSTLNFDYEISKQLYQLYDYHLWNIQQFIIHKHLEKLEESITFAKEFSITWRQAILSLKRGDSIS